jgi:2-dehydro-3-deoxyphosphooctonate aldolase (KDO 8-P synthase)
MNKKIAEEIKVGKLTFGKNRPLGFILGPCVIESYDQLLDVASYLKNFLPYPFVLKGSFDKANRSSISSFRGVGIEKGLKYLEKIKKDLDIAVTTDIHLPEHAEIVASVCDLIQIPAFLARQTDLVVNAAKTMLPIHVKKGQFMSPYDMEHVANKILHCGNSQIMFTERGTTFGYKNLVNDFRSFPIMQKYCSATCYDITHSGQLPGQGEESGGERAFMEKLAKAAVATGADILFLETHKNPKEAKSDKATQWPLDQTIPLLKKLYELRMYLLEERTVNV